MPTMRSQRLRARYNESVDGLEPSNCWAPLTLVIAICPEIRKSKKEDSYVVYRNRMVPQLVLVYAASWIASPLIVDWGSGFRA
jgi:hypothetical protein